MLEKLHQIIFSTRIASHHASGGAATMLDVYNLKNMIGCPANFRCPTKMDVYKIEITNILMENTAGVTWSGKFGQSLSIQHLDQQTTRLSGPSGSDHVNKSYDSGFPLATENYFYSNEFMNNFGSVYKMYSFKHILESNMWPMPLVSIRPDDPICFKNHVYSPNSSSMTTYIHDVMIKMWVVKE